MIWPEARHNSEAHHRLRQTILKLKQAGIPIVREQGFIRINCPIVTDFDAVLSVQASGDSALAPTSFQVLPEYWPAFSGEFSRWVDTRKSQITASLVPTLLTQIRQGRHRAEWSRVEELARTCLDVDPFNEEAVLARAESIAMRGGKVEAIALLDKYLENIGDREDDIRLPPSVMRRRISERRTGISYRGDTEFMGRASTMEFLTTVLQHARVGEGGTVVMSGPAGIGKSRVLDEFGKFGELQGARIERLFCRASDLERPLSVFIDLSPRLLQLRGAIGCNEDTISSLRALNSTEKTHTEVVTEKELVYPRIRSALFDVLDAVCEEQPIVLSLDDVHWMDPISGRLVHELTQWCRSHKLLLLLTLRTDANTISAREVWPDATHLELQSFDSKT
ncbi:MAG: ATP-binding protein, partial [Gemmatimonadaceae bacterium]|nr:ATP-binding protein [Gemmatimonadaceae bacterium]